MRNFLILNYNGSNLVIYFFKYSFILVSVCCFYHSKNGSSLGLIAGESLSESG